MIKLILAICFFAAIFGSTSVKAIPIQLDPYMATLPFFDGASSLGDVNVEIQGEKLNWIEKKGLIKVLEHYLRPDTLSAIEKLGNEVRPEMLPFPLSFNVQEYRLDAAIRLSQRASESTDLGPDLSEEKRLALQPAPIGGPSTFVENRPGVTKNSGEIF